MKTILCTHRVQCHFCPSPKAVIRITFSFYTVEHCRSSSQQVAMEQASERGASSWLTAISIAEYGFTLHKQAFWDALCIRYGWRPARLPSHCPCGVAFSVNHAMSCPKGALPSIRHDRIRDITAQLLTEVCPNVAIEPTLQPLTGERFSLRSTNVEDEARLDIKAQDFWNKNGSSTFFDVRVVNPYAPSNNKSTAAACYRKHDMEKRHKYKRRVLDVEHGSFTTWSSPRVEDRALLPQSHSDSWPASSPTRCHNLTVQLLASSAARLHSH